MPWKLTRRGLVAALLAGGTGAASLSGADRYLEAMAPLSGSVWRETGPVPDTVESPYGDASITYDDAHIPHVDAGSAEAAYFAVGYAQAADRLVQLDLFRRRAAGTLASVVGESAVENDVFKTKMDFQGAAEAAARAIEGTEAGRVAQAYADGINSYVETGPTGFAYELLGSEPAPWSVADSMLIVLEMGWLLNGGFRSLERQVLRRTLDDDAFRTLYPDRLDHGAPIIRSGRTGGAVSGVGGTPDTGGNATADDGGSTADPPDSLSPAFVDWLAGFDGPDWAGSNCWTVSGEFTENGRPILCSDPHLMLDVPPIWYQQRVSLPDVTVRGVAVPGTPFVPVGENDHCAWGITNVGANAVDCYTYETDGDRYRVGEEWRAFDTETRTVAVSDGTDREVTVRKTVDGPYLEREVGGETHAVGVSWVGMGGVRDAVGIYRCSHADSLAAFREGLRDVDVIVQNFHYADRDGRTCYQLAGKLPIRRVDGEVVPSDRVFDGSAGEAEWDGFDPFGASTWEGFIPFDELPAVVDPDYVASANQRTADDPTYPIATSFASGFRARRIYEVLDELTAGDGLIDVETMRDLQLDTVSTLARSLVPSILDARDRMPDGAGPWLDALAAWDHRMVRESRAALVFVRLYDHYREALWADTFKERGLSERFWPSPWVDARLAAGDGADAMPAGVDPSDALVTAMERALDEIETEGWETYGDYNVTAFDHPFGFLLPGLNYDRHPTDGGPLTVRRFNAAGPDGASYRQVVQPGGPSVEVLPGGNDGSPFSAHYQDQLRAWADGEYRRAGEAASGDPDVSLEGVGE